MKIQDSGETIPTTPLSHCPIDRETSLRNLSGNLREWLLGYLGESRGFWLMLLAITHQSYVIQSYSPFSPTATSPTSSSPTQYTLFLFSIKQSYSLTVLRPLVLRVAFLPFLYHVYLRVVFICTYTTSKPIELKNPGCTGFEANSQNFKA